MKFNEILKDMRESNCITKTDLGKIIGISRQQITAFEKGDAMPGSEILLVIADHFKISTDHLLGREGYVTVRKDNKKRYIFLPDELDERDCEFIRDIISARVKRLSKKHE